MAEYVMLKLNKDFQRLYNRGKSYVSPALVVYFTKNHAGFCRLGITTGKKVGCAVKRNRAKRIIKEAFTTCLKDINTNCDIVIVARTKAAYIKSTQATEMLYDILVKAGLISNNNLL